MQGKASGICCLVLGILSIARAAHADPHLDGRVTIGARLSSMNDSHSTVVSDDSAVRLAVDGVFGLRVGPVLVGVHGGVATPQRVFAGNFDEGETEASAESTIYPVDVGLGVEVATGGGTWVGGWLGATVAFKHATSPATHINAIDYTGDIPAASWSDRTTALGVGAAVGYDVPKTDYGRFGVRLSLESRPVGGVGFRRNDGGQTFTSEEFTTQSLTVGLTYRR